jgi:hypothetical protein
VIPDVVVHYAHGAPFLSIMDLDDAGRDALVRDGHPTLGPRLRDPTYLPIRRRVESELHAQFVAAGGQPLRRHPHYALIGRSERSERRGGLACLLDRAKLPEAQVSFTWSDSFTFDPDWRRLTGKEHPACGRVYRLSQLPEVLERWSGSERPAWMELEVQLWYDPSPSEYAVIELTPR